MGPTEGLIGLLNILLTAVATTWLSAPELLLLGAVWFGYALLHSATTVLPVFFSRLRLLRWFVLALLLIYGLSALQAPLEARAELLIQGGRQILVLLLLLLAVCAVLEPLSANQRIYAFAALLRPLTPLGIEPTRAGRMLAWSLHDALELRARLQGSWRGQRTGVVASVAQLCLELEGREVPASSPEQTPRYSTAWFWLMILPLLALISFRLSF